MLKDLVFLLRLMCAVVLTTSLFGAFAFLSAFVLDGDGTTAHLASMLMVITVCLLPVLAYDGPPDFQLTMLGMMGVFTLAFGPMAVLGHKPELFGVNASTLCMAATGIWAVVTLARLAHGERRLAKA